MMSCGPVTACATETPCTPRILAATSRAFPGDVSIRMNAFTAILVSSRACGLARPWLSWWRNQSTLLIIYIKSAARFAAEIAGINVLLQQRARPILVVAEHPMHHLHDREAGVQPNQVSQLERTHRLIGSELHRGVDIRDPADSFVHRVNRFVNHREQHAIDDESREILRGNRSLAEVLGEDAGLLKSRLRGRESADNFDQLHRWHRVHEMHPDDAVSARGLRS